MSNKDNTPEVQDLERSLTRPEAITQIKKQAFQGVLNAMLDMYVRKNHDYGNAFDDSLDKFGYLAVIVRMNDKMGRLSTLTDPHRYGQAKVKDESIRDTLLDLANYAVMTVVHYDAALKDEEYIKDVQAKSINTDESLEKLMNVPAKYFNRYDIERFCKYFNNGDFKNKKDYEQALKYGYFLGTTVIPGWRETLKKDLNNNGWFFHNIEFPESNLEESNKTCLDTLVGELNKYMLEGDVKNEKN